MAGYLDHYLKRLDSILSDPLAIELAINGNAGIWVEKAGESHMRCFDGLVLSPSDVTDLAMQVANDAKQPLTNVLPMVSHTVPYGDAMLRVQAIISPAAFGGTVLSFRIFRQRAAGEEPKRFSFLRKQGVSLEQARLAKIRELRDLVESGAVGDDSDAVLRACVDMKLNMIVSGPTSAGKTELVRRLMWMIPDHERLVLIEDSAEALPHQPNHVSLIAARDEKSPRSADKLLQATLRLRPDRIILGEVRGSEAVTFLGAINTGHDGSFTTLHAGSGRKAMDKMAHLVTNTGTQMSYGEILRYLRGSIDAVIQTGRDGQARGIMEVYFPVLDDDLL